MQPSTRRGNRTSSAASAAPSRPRAPTRSGVRGIFGRRRSRWPPKWRATTSSALGASTHRDRPGKSRQPVGDPRADRVACTGRAHQSLDAEQARTNVEQVRAAIPVLETSLAEAEHRLAALLGLAPAALHDDLAKRRRFRTSRSRSRSAFPQTSCANDRTSRPPSVPWRRPPHGSVRRRGALSEPHAVRIGRARSDDDRRAHQWQLARRERCGKLAQTVFDGGRISAQIEIQNARQEQAWRTTGHGSECARRCRERTSVHRQQPSCGQRR